MKILKNYGKIICILILVSNYQISDAQQNLAQQTYAIFERHCLDCHGEFGSYTDALLINHTNLIEDRSIIPRQPDDSELYLRLLGDTDSGSQMPLGQEALDPKAIATIRDWIEAGAPDWEAIPKPKRHFITTKAMLKAIHTHVVSLTDFDRSFARYFTLTHLYNAGASDDNLRAYRNALSKLINSLSWGRRVVKPKPVDKEETIFYIDLRHYEWDSENNPWYKIEQAYPYGIRFELSTYRTLCQETNCNLPFVRADWFIATASLPPLYHDILDLPKTDWELEERLEVNVAANIKNAPGIRVWRAGFNESGVSRNNRVVERHESRYGAYWKSYDFAGNTGQQNIFTHPLNFVHDGGEIIFNLPNGLQGYYLSTASGNRLDEAPIDIVSNTSARDPVVRNGFSCMSCHTEGMKTFEDQVRPAIEQVSNPSYDKAQALRLYVEKLKMDTHVQEDIERYRWAIEAAGGVFGGSEPIQQLVKQFEGPLDAIHAAAEVGLETADFLKKIRENSTLQNAGLTVLGVEKGNIKRDVWTSQFGKLVPTLNLGKYIQPKPLQKEVESQIISKDFGWKPSQTSTDPEVEKRLANEGNQNTIKKGIPIEIQTPLLHDDIADLRLPPNTPNRTQASLSKSETEDRERKLRIDEKTPFSPSHQPSEMVLIPAGEFQMGSHGSLFGEFDEKPEHPVYVDAFYMDVHEVTNSQYKAFVDTNPEWRKDRISPSYHDGNYLKLWNGNNYPSGMADHPVVYISWYSAMAYAKWAGKRLPTEAEWEKAARGALVNQRYPWGSLSDRSKANYDSNGINHVGMHPPNGYGLYDMVGNVWEWCLDRYDSNFYSSSPRRNPLSGGSIINVTNNFTKNKNNRVLRGGSWKDRARHVRCANRFFTSPTDTDNNTGFRCVKPTKP